LDFPHHLIKAGDMKCTGCKDHGICTMQTKGSVAMDECPCKDCLVKGICESTCDKLNEHYASINNAYRKIMARKVKKDA